MVKESLEPSRRARRILAAILMVVAESKGIMDWLYGYICSSSVKTMLMPLETMNSINYG